MKIIKLNLSHVERLLDLEENVYWQSRNWNNLWEEEAKVKFRKFIKDYLTHYPDGCFGLEDNNKEVFGAIFLLKTINIKPVPYLHKPSKYFNHKGKNAYVSLFVVKKGKDEEVIAQKLYKHAEKVALLKLGCKTIVVVIYSSPLEEKILIGNNYQKLNKEFEWEVYPGYQKPCHIYYYDLLMEK